MDSAWGWKLAIAFVLLVITWSVFGQARHHQFVNYDDPLYVLENPHINAGLSWRSAGWAFTHVHSQNWHPLTSISHMLDVQLFGLEPGWHHCVNVLLHSLAAVLLFLVLEQMTGNIWASAFVAAVFAIHPLRVESVAWIAERKDVLSGVFFMLTLWYYVRWVRQRTPGSYIAMAIAFACGLMSKPMLVTTPVVLLLLDYWPLRRIQNSEFRGQRSEGKNQKAAALPREGVARLFLEKIPLFALVAGSVMATLLAQNFALGSPEHLPIKWRITNAIVTYWEYVWQMVWPRDLVPFYLHPEGRLPLWQIAAAAAALLVISAIAFIRRRKNPYFIVGWLWYLVMLLPVIGVIQVGLQGHADRYTYLPQIGLYIAITWFIRDFTASWRGREIILAPAAALVVGFLAVLSWKQTAHWHDTESLWSYTLGVTPESDVAHVGLAGILAVQGRTDEAIEHYRRAVEMRSGNAGAEDGLARLLAEQRKVDEAIEHWKKALEVQPDNLRASNSLALMYVHRGDYPQAVAQWQNTLAFDPDDADAANNLAWVLATTSDLTVRDPGKALELAHRAAQLTNEDNSSVLRTLAVVYSENRRFDEAIKTAEQALRLAEANGNATLAADLRSCIEIFKEGKTWREARAQP
jgi:protein O-mannosyl-transferase